MSGVRIPESAPAYTCTYTSAAKYNLTVISFRQVLRFPLQESSLAMVQIRERILEFVRRRLGGIMNSVEQTCFVDTMVIQPSHIDVQG